MQKTLKKVTSLTLKSVLFIGIFFAVERFCHKATDGFMLHKISSDQIFEGEEPSSFLSEEELTEVIPLLDQPFTYLKSGGQCYAFISEDKKTILKFFKMHHLRETAFAKKFKIPGFFDLGNLRIVRYREKRFNHIFGSCKIAFEQMKEQTGLLYIHLNKTKHLNKKVKIQDKLGIYHMIDLDETKFLVQKTAVVGYSKFHELMKDDHVEEAQECITSLVDLFVYRYQKGIDNEDPVIRKNFGFIGNQAIEIDLGSYIENNYLKEPALYKEKLVKEMGDFKEWISIYYPILLPHLEEKISSVK